MPVSAEVVESLRAKFDTVLPHLDERAVRLLLAAEVRSLCHGGIASVASPRGQGVPGCSRAWRSWRSALPRWAASAVSVRGGER